MKWRNSKERELMKSKSQISKQLNTKTLTPPPQLSSQASSIVSKPQPLINSTINTSNETVGTKTKLTSPCNLSLNSNNYSLSPANTIRSSTSFNEGNLIILSPI